MRARGIESHITSMHDGFYPIAFKMCSRVALAKAFTVSDFLQGGSYVLRGGKDKQRKPSSQVDKKKPPFHSPRLNISPPCAFVIWPSPVGGTISRTELLKPFRIPNKLPYKPQKALNHTSVVICIPCSASSPRRSKNRNALNRKKPRPSPNKKTRESCQFRSLRETPVAINPAFCSMFEPKKLSCLWDVYYYFFLHWRQSCKIA